MTRDFLLELITHSVRYQCLVLYSVFCQGCCQRCIAPRAHLMKASSGGELTEDGPDEYKFPGGVGHRDDSFVEYDLDHEDRAWLEKFNDGQDRLPAQRFELLLWKLDLVNADANDRQSAAVGNCLHPQVYTCMAFTQLVLFGDSDW